MRHKLVVSGLAFLAVHLGGYLALSLSGAYMPSAVGTNGIKGWLWMPRGFADESGKVRAGLVIAFYPLYWLDSRYWHSDWTGMSDQRKMPSPA